MAELLHRELTGKIIGAYYAVFNGLSRTHPEFLFENAMVKVLQSLDVRCRQQPVYEIGYKEQPVGRQRLDIFVADISRISIDNLKDWMRENGIRLGILANFLDSRIRPVFIVDTEFGKSKH